MFEKPVEKAAEGRRSVTRTPGLERLLGVACALTAVWVVVWRLDFGAAPELTRFRDDAYYYFCWARSVAAGQGPCVTSGVPTSGVHLAWAWLLALGAMLFGPAALPGVAQALGLMLHGLTAVLLAGRSTAMGWAALLYAGNPFVLSEAQNGQETALACFATACLARAVPARDVVFAVVAVLTVLARSELALLVAALAWSRQPWSWRCLVAPVAALVVYAGANLLLAGHVVQDSAMPIPWLFEQHFRASDPTWIERLRWFWWWLRPCLLGGPWAFASPVLAATLVYAALLPARRWAPALTLVLCVAAWAVGAEDLTVAWVAALLWWLSPSGLTHVALRAHAVGWLAILVLHHLIRHYPRPYYFAPLAVSGALAVGVLAGRRPRLGLVVVLAAAAWNGFGARSAPEAFPWQVQSRLAGQYLRQIVAAHEPIGCFNSGLVTWLHEGRVVNLDGVVNRPAFEALRRGALDAYLDAEQVCWLVDAPVQFARDDPWPHASGRHFGADFDPERDLREVARFLSPWVGGTVKGTEHVALYWRVGRGPVPQPNLAAQVLGPNQSGGFDVLWPGRRDVTLVLAQGSRIVRELVRGKDGCTFVLEVQAQAAGRYSLAETSPTDPAPHAVLALEFPHKSRP